MSINIGEFKKKINNSIIFEKYFGPGSSKRNVRCIDKSHRDSTPSMSIDYRVGLFFCHGCGLSGDVISLVQIMESLSFRQAVEFIASLCGISIEEEFSTKPKRAEDIAQNMFSYYLTKHSQATQYLESRGVDINWARSVGVGFAPYSSRWINTLQKRHPEVDPAPLIMPTGRPKLSGRITFPIYDRGGDLVAFIGRSLNNEAPPYLKTAESKDLYGINMIFRFSGPPVIVEGTMDHLLLTQNGIKAVAALGTAALNKRTLSPLKLHGQKVYLFFDNDMAGEKATKKAIRELYSVGLIPMILESDRDPDETIIKIGKDKFLKMMEEAPTAAQWAASKYDLADAVYFISGAIASCPSSAMLEIEKENFRKKTTITITPKKQSRLNYENYILNNVSSFPELFSELISSNIPTWIKDSIISGYPSPDAIKPTETEVRYGIRRIICSSMETHLK